MLLAGSGDLPSEGLRPCLGGQKWGHSEGLPLPAGTLGLCGMPQGWLPDPAATCGDCQVPTSMVVLEARLQTVLSVPPQSLKARGNGALRQYLQPLLCKYVGLGRLWAERA